MLADLGLSLDELEDVIDAAPAEEKARLLKIVEELSMREERASAQKDFLAFVKSVWPDFIGGNHHKRMAKLFEEVARGEKKRIIINLGPRHAIMTSMNIPTTQGMKRMADLQPGDFVFGPDGKPTRVLGKSEVFHGRQLYRVTTDDGFSLVVDGEHLWTVSLKRGDRKYFDYTTEQLWERQNGTMFRASRKTKEIKRQSTTTDPSKVRLPMLPPMSAVERPEADLPVDPYVLGVWLGDGTKNNGVITSCDEDAAIIREEIARRGYTTTDQSTRYTFGILDLKVKLREIGVLSDKHIPELYMNASENQRRDLLKGMMDTDGCVSKKGQCYWMQSNKAFIDQVRQLLASLGIKNSVSESEAKIGDKSYGTTWRISFYAKGVAHLPRKEIRAAQAKGDHFGRYIKVEKLETYGDTQCIKVDREDGLFMAGEGHIITHNTKSEFASYLLPAWFLGQFPKKKIMQVSNTGELAEGFGRKVRNLVDSAEYKRIFPDTELRADSKAAGRWNTNYNGEYFATGVNGTITGRGADLLIIDDPHSESEAVIAQFNPEVYDKVYNWYSSGPRQRLQPGGAIIIVMTRWSERDLTGQVLENSLKNNGDKWEVIEFPAILPSGKPLWPEFWPLEELEAVKAEIPTTKWQAQYQQQPTSETNAIIKRDWWQPWTQKEPPKYDFVLMSMDTAFEKKNSADYSAVTIFGVWYNDEDGGQPNLILLEAWRERLEFPDLKKRTLEFYQEWEPDGVIIEKKATGAPLIYELRRSGVPVQEFTPSRGQDKITRLNAIADIFASGKVWAPQTRWADEVINEVAAFPSGRNDDFVDCVSLALARFRSGGFIGTVRDEPDDDYAIYKTRKGNYY